MRIAIAAAALLLLASSRARATTAADFLNLDIGARATAMGGAFSSVADDAAAMYWNPAALTRIDHRSAAFMHAIYVDSSYFDYASYAENFGKSGALGASLQYYSAGSINKTDANGADIGSFSPYDLAASLGYACKLPDYDFISDISGLSLGATVKYVQSRIVSSAHTTALDLGLLTPAYFDGRLRAAFTATNLGGQLDYGLTREPLPRTLRLGASFELAPRWLLSADMVSPLGASNYAAVGTEYWIFTKGPWKAAGRAGVVTGLAGVSLGFGLNYGGAAFDYAFVPVGAIGDAHRLSLTYNF
ncbi:MAG: PorV/PorQ family protein [Elusimicrobiota bacterium]